jgi:hypothetical protein
MGETLLARCEPRHIPFDLSESTTKSLSRAAQLTAGLCRESG